MFSKSAAYYDLIYPEKRNYRAEAALVSGLLDELRPGCHTILDVACGTGEHLHLLKDRYQVEGIDINPELIAQARKKLPDVEFHVADMRRFRLGRTFDAVLCLYSSIAYANTKQDLLLTSRSLARHTAPGGVVLVEPWYTPDRLLSGHVGHDHAEQDGTTIERRSLLERRGRRSTTTFDYRVERPGKPVETFSERHHLGLFTVEELSHALSSAGLQVEYRSDLFSDRGIYLCRLPGRLASPERSES